MFELPDLTALRAVQYQDLAYDLGWETVVGCDTIETPVSVKSVHIKNFKSIVELSLELGDVNVFIGENGSGKSNILEALAFGSSAVDNKLDHEFLASRGVRTTDVRFMRSAFIKTLDEPVVIAYRDNEGREVELRISAASSAPYPRWELDFHLPKSEEKLARIEQLESQTRELIELAKGLPGPETQAYVDEAEELVRRLWGALSELRAQGPGGPLSGLIIYSPENSALRTFEQEGQIVPLGIHGEGLLKLLRVLSDEDPAAWTMLGENLGLLDWFAAIDLEPETSSIEPSIRLRDRFISDALPSFDQRSANEGFLYLLFFFALVLSTRTPRLFAIENVDTSLNPKACSELMRRLAALAIERKKQVLFTTHNPSLLDGLNLHDDKQRLFVVSRNRDGHTIARRIKPPQPVGNELPIRLSEAFTRGLLGGIPQNF